jgi:hypothetical protein
MEGYKYIVFAFNHALRALRDIDVPLPQSHGLNILAHRSDPKVMTGIHNGHQSERKPDLPLVSLDHAREAFEEGDPGTWDDYAFRTAGDPPRRSFRWSDALSAWEVRRIKPAFRLPPDKYTIQLAETIPPQRLPKTIHDALHETVERTAEETTPKKLETSLTSGTSIRTNS